MWLGAPFMKRNTACLALAGKCGAFGASGFTDAARASRLSRSIRARPANPPPTCHRNSRRVRPQGVTLGRKRLVHISKLIQVENHAAHLLERFAMQEIEHGGGFGRLWRTRQRETIGEIDLLCRIVTGFAPQAFG